MEKLEIIPKVLEIVEEEGKEYFIVFLKFYKDELCDRLMEHNRAYEKEEMKIVQYLKKLKIFSQFYICKNGIRDFVTMIQDLELGEKISKQYEIESTKNIDELKKFCEEKERKNETILLEEFSVRPIKSFANWPLDKLFNDTYRWMWNDSYSIIPKCLTYYTDHFWDWWKKEGGKEHGYIDIKGSWIFTRGEAEVKFNTIKWIKKEIKEKKEEEDKKIENFDLDIEINEYTLRCSTIQMFVLLLFNENDKIGMERIVQNIFGIFNEKTFKAIGVGVYSLCKYIKDNREKVLRRNVLIADRQVMKTRKIKGNRFFRINEIFKSVDRNVDVRPKKGYSFLPSFTKKMMMEEQRKKELIKGYEIALNAFLVNHLKRYRTARKDELLVLLADQFKDLFKLLLL